MNRLFDRGVNNPKRAERGASAVEYGLLISGIAAIAALAVFTFGGAVSNLFTDSCDTVSAEVGQPC